jgi:hypothetical protein
MSTLRLGSVFGVGCDSNDNYAGNGNHSSSPHSLRIRGVTATRVWTLMSYTRVLLLHILKPLCLTSKFEIIWGIVGNSWLYAVCLSISIAYVSCRLTAASKCSSNSSHFMTCREIVYKYNVGSAFHYRRTFYICFAPLMCELVLYFNFKYRRNVTHHQQGSV